MCLDNISKHFTVDNMKKTGLNGYVYDFSVDYITIDTSNIWNIQWKNITWYKIIFRFIKKMFIGVLRACTKGSFGESSASSSTGHVKFVSLHNWPC